VPAAKAPIGVGYGSISTAADVAAVAAASLLPAGDDASLACPAVSCCWWYSAEGGGRWPASSATGPWSRRIPLKVCPPMFTAVWYASSASGSSTGPIRTQRNTASTLSSGGNLPPPPSPIEQHHHQDHHCYIINAPCHSVHPRWCDDGAVTTHYST
jgi:hypothetical protein